MRREKRRQERYKEKEKKFGNELMRWLERRIVLDVVDTQWKDHLLSLDHLKEGIGLRGYAQKDPIVEFKKEAFVMFEDMMGRIDNETIRYLFHIQIQQARQDPDDMQTAPENQGSGPGGAGPGGAGPQGSGGQRPTPPAVASRSGGAAAAMASAAARATEAPAQRLPDVARQLDRKQQRQQQDLQYQTGAAQAEPPKPVVPPPKSAATIPVPAAAAKNTKSATAKGSSHPVAAIVFQIAGFRFKPEHDSSVEHGFLSESSAPP